MLKKSLSLFSLGLLSTIAFAVSAEPAKTYVVVAPNCLVKNLTSDYKKLSTINELSVIEVNDSGMNQLIAAKHRQTEPCGGFFDVSAEWNDYKMKGLSVKSFLRPYLKSSQEQQQQQQPVKTYEIKYQAQVNQLIGQITPDLIWSNLTKLSSFENRYANSSLGKDAADWISQQVLDMAKRYNRDDVVVYTVDTPGYKQPSVVAKIGKSTEAGVVVGGHMDTIAFFGETWPPELASRQPGADDDGSGSVTIMEAARTILASGMKFKKPIYFIWYAAEEEGLVGSKYVVRDFKQKNIPVEAVAQFDMTGFSNSGDPTLWLLDDHVNRDLTTFLDKLITTYVKQPVGHTTCGYGCSDHASWTNGGFAASAPFEAKFGKENKHIHTSDDSMQYLTLSHMANFAKLATAFAVEIAEPVS